MIRTLLREWQKSIPIVPQDDEITKWGSNGYREAGEKYVKLIEKQLNKLSSKNMAWARACVTWDSRPITGLDDHQKNSPSQVNEKKVERKKKNVAFQEPLVSSVKTYEPHPDEYPEKPRNNK